jgi:hypothetical protein
VPLCSARVPICFGIGGDFSGIRTQEFDVFLTVDQGVEYQQNLVGLDLAIIVMVATSNDIGDLRPLMPRLRETLNSVSPGILFKVKI